MVKIETKINIKDKDKVSHVTLEAVEDLALASLADNRLAKPNYFVKHQAFWCRKVSNLLKNR